MVPVGGVNPVTQKAAIGRNDNTGLAFPQWHFSPRLRAACGPQFALPSGIGSERSHHGFRDHSYSEQHLTGGVHLFCRDSDLAGLEKLLDVHLSYLRSEIRAGRVYEI